MLRRFGRREKIFTKIVELITDCHFLTTNFRNEKI